MTHCTLMTSQSLFIHFLQPRVPSPHHHTLPSSPSTLVYPPTIIRFPPLSPSVAPPLSYQMPLSSFHQLPSASPISCRAFPQQCLSLPPISCPSSKAITNPISPPSVVPLHLPIRWLSSPLISCSSILALCHLYFLTPIFSPSFISISCPSSPSSVALLPTHKLPLLTHICCSSSPLISCPSSPHQLPLLTLSLILLTPSVAPQLPSLQLIAYSSGAMHLHFAELSNLPTRKILERFSLSYSITTYYKTKNMVKEGSPGEPPPALTCAMPA